MFYLIQRKIAIKLAVIIIIVVAAVSIVSTILFNKGNRAVFNDYLQNDVAYAVKFAELGYDRPLWNLDILEIAKISEALLNSKMIVAVNVFDSTNKFFSGNFRDLDTTDIVINRLNQKFEISDKDINIKKVSKTLVHDNEIIGNFELFYTEKFIEESNRKSSIKMTVSFMGIAICIILILFVGVNRLLIKPILELGELSQRIADTNDYSLRLLKPKSKDEVGDLYGGFVKMLEQINIKDTERNKLYNTLQESEKRFRSLFHDLQDAINSEKYSFRIDPDSDSDDLSESLNKMLSTLEHADRETKNQNWIKSGQTELSKIIGGEQNIEELCKNAINFITKYVGAQVGTIFLSSQTTEELTLTANYAFKYRKGLSNRFKPGEGLVGQAVLEREQILFTDIPEDYFKIESSLGNTVPKNIIVVPLIYELNIMGAVELATTFEISSLVREFLDLSGNIVAVAINAAQSNEKLKTLLNQTKNQSEELKVQQEELRRANEELEEQTQTLKESESKLQIQQEELQASNEELEEKTEMLESQKEETDKKNISLQQKQKEIEEKARQLELATRYKSEFLSNMSHELRTPLNSMLLLARMLADNDEKNLSDEQVESAASIHRSGQNLLRLINDILDLSKIEAKKIELNISNVKLSTLISNFNTEFKHIAQEKKLEFNIDKEEGLPESVETDEQRVEQIVRNLLSNSFKFTEKGEVRLSLRRPDKKTILQNKDIPVEKCVAVSISDTGPGIPEEKLKVIFEAFKQVDGSISRRHGGTGLGLSISRELSHIIGGEIQVKSEEGHGAEFVLYIPYKFKGPKEIEGYIPPVKPSLILNKTDKVPLPEKKQESTAPSEPRVTEITSHHGSKTVLIIEDDSEFSGILEKFFQNQGYDSFVAPDGETGIKLVVEKNPSAIILDIGLPGIDGWAVLNELKNNPETRHIPVHIMSAFDNINEGLHKGAVGYLTKPVSTDDLKSALNRIEGVLKSDVKELLIVEDDQELRNTILRLMAANDILATPTGTGEEALELLKKKRFDCMVLDLGLPDISGFDLLEKIELDGEIDKPPVIIYTGRTLSKDETDRLEKYSSSIVIKSAVSMERLLDETALFLHRVESKMPESHQQMLRTLRDKESVLTDKEVLLVDDDMRNAFALKKFLTNKGMNVKIADNGKKALDMLDKEEKVPDIILMDIMMPVMDGYETIKRIRSHSEFKNIPILALTAKAMETDREECIKSGANDYLSKPVDVAKLLSLLRVWLY